MNAFEKSIKIPDLRFESSFLRSLQRYADSSAGAKKGPLTDAELELLSDQQGPESRDEQLKPIGAITPGVITYAVIKDIVLRPLFEGFTWAMILILFRPTMALISAHGHRIGTSVTTILGRIFPKVYR